MSTRSYWISAGVAALLITSWSGPANAMTIQECSQQYQAAKSAGTLQGMNWNQFRHTVCAAGASAAPAQTAPAQAAPAPAAPAQAVTPQPSGRGLTMHECSQQYQAAKSAGTLQGMTWNQFRSAVCSAGGAAAAAPAAVPQAAARPTLGATGNAVFPRGISPKYANMTAGRARMYTCLDQYNANKATNGNAGLRWTQLGGGYYSQCAKLLGGQ